MIRHLQNISGKLLPREYRALTRPTSPSRRRSLVRSQDPRSDRSDLLASNTRMTRSLQNKVQPRLLRKVPSASLSARQRTLHQVFYHMSASTRGCPGSLTLCLVAVNSTPAQPHHNTIFRGLARLEAAAADKSARPGPPPPPEADEVLEFDSCDTTDDQASDLEPYDEYRAHTISDGEEDGKIPTLGPLNAR